SISADAVEQLLRLILFGAELHLQVERPSVGAQCLPPTLEVEGALQILAIARRGPVGTDTEHATTRRRGDQRSGYLPALASGDIGRARAHRARARHRVQGSHRESETTFFVQAHFDQRTLLRRVGRRADDDLANVSLRDA